MTPFRLLPFAPGPAVSGLSVTGTAQRHGRTLRACYRLGGDLSRVLLPAPVEHPGRRDGLWQSTCLELFAGWPGEARYLEVNLSLSGDWNAYSFAGYRQGMAPLAVARFQALAGEPGFELEMPGLEDAPGPLEVGVCAVLEHADRTRSYWALMHSGERPDFHRREGFRLRI